MVNDDILLQKSAIVCTSAGDRHWTGRANSRGRGWGHRGPLEAVLFTALGPRSCLTPTIAAWLVRCSTQWDFVANHDQRESQAEVVSIPFRSSQAECELGTDMWAI